MDERKEIEKTIIETLKQYPYGLSISELAKILKINRVTLSKYLDVLKEKGMVSYRPIGRAKVWFVSEDINILEAIFGETDLNKILRKDSNNVYYIGDMKFMIFPSEIIQDLYLLIGKKYGLKTVKELGKKLGSHIATTYKIYSGIERVLKPEVIEYLIRFIEKIGLGKIHDVYIDEKTLEFIITFEYTLESDEIINIVEELKDIKEKPKCYLLEGFLEGLLSALLNMDIVIEERKCKLHGEKVCEFYAEKR